MQDQKKKKNIYTVRKSFTDVSNQKWYLANKKDK